MVDSREDVVEERFGDVEEDVMVCLGVFFIKVKVVEDVVEEMLLFWVFWNFVSIK